MLQMLRHGNERAGARRLCGAAASSGRLRACKLVLERWRLLGWVPMAARRAARCAMRAALQVWLYTANFLHASVVVAHLSGARRARRLLGWAVGRCAHRARWWRLRQVADQRCAVALRFRAIQALLMHTARRRRARRRG